jgi:quercetin dioxygenase-like cupin family protein
VLQGAAKLLADGQEFRLEPGTFARVGPGQRRKIVTGPEGARILAVGATAGKAYEIVSFTVPQTQ